MKTMTILRSVLGLATVLCATMAIGVTAEARSLPAFAGQAQNPADYSCFTNANGTVTNSCGATEQFCVPLVSDSASHTVQITLYAPDSGHNISCSAAALFANGSVNTFSGWVGAPSFGSDVQLTLSPSTVPSEGSLYACCSMAPTSRIDSINY